MFVCEYVCLCVSECTRIRTRACELCVSKPNTERSAAEFRVLGGFFFQKKRDDQHTYR